MTTLETILSDVKIRSSTDGKEWSASLDGEPVCHAPNKEILMVKAAIYLKRLCCEDLVNDNRGRKEK